MGARGPLPKVRKTLAFRKGLPAPPAWLDAEARREYRRVASEIERATGTPGQQVDLGVLATYAQSYSDIRRLTLILREEGEVLTGDEGGKYLNPSWTMLVTARKMMLAAISKLGFSPADRARCQPGPGSMSPEQAAVAEFAGGAGHR